jgi:hypothetical protein
MQDMRVCVVCCGQARRPLQKPAPGTGACTHACNAQVESGVDKNGNSLSESDIAWGCPSEELFDEQLLSQVCCMRARAWCDWLPMHGGQRAHARSPAVGWLVLQQQQPHQARFNAVRRATLACPCVPPPPTLCPAAAAEAAHRCAGHLLGLGLHGAGRPGPTPVRLAQGARACCVCGPPPPRPQPCVAMARGSATPCCAASPALAFVPCTRMPLQVPRKAWPGLMRMPDLAGMAGSAQAVEAFVTLVRRWAGGCVVRVPG